MSTRQRRGGANLPLLLVLFVVALLVGGLVFLASTRETDPGGDSGTPAPRAPRSARDAAPEVAGEEPARAIAASEPLRPEFPLRGAARGTLRGDLVLQGGARAPERWTLVLEASAAVTSTERADPRRIEFANGERSFRVDDLPLAGYRVRAEALGLNGQPLEVLLVPSSASVFVTLSLARAGFVDGSVLASDGTPAEGLEVTLEPLGQAGAKASLARQVTDIHGAYRFEAVLDGEYRVSFGPRAAPLLPALELSVSAPSLRLAQQTLPPLGTLSLRVVELGGALAAGARVLGSNSAGGAFEAVADDGGRVLARHLLPGTWRVEALYEERASGGAALELEAGTTLEAQLTLRP